MDLVPAGNAKDNVLEALTEGMLVVLLGDKLEGHSLEALIVGLVKLLRPRMSGLPVAKNALGSLLTLAEGEGGNVFVIDLIVSAGGIAKLVILLASGNDETASLAVNTLQALLVAGPHSIMLAISEAGCIPELVALLAGGGGSEAPACSVRLLADLAANEPNSLAIHESGGIQPLVDLLEGGPDSPAAKYAARVLYYVSRHAVCYDQLLKAICYCFAPLIDFQELSERMQDIASFRLDLLMSSIVGPELPELTRIINEAVFVNVSRVYASLLSARELQAVLVAKEAEKVRDAAHISWACGH